jgi:hypothetical protein
MAIPVESKNVDLNAIYGPFVGRIGRIYTKAMVFSCGKSSI